MANRDFCPNEPQFVLPNPSHQHVHPNNPLKLKGFTGKHTVLKKSSDWVAGEPVPCEPVSPLFSLLNRERTGKNLKIGCFLLKYA
jgi:hypothetical protein